MDFLSEYLYFLIQIATITERLRILLPVILYIVVTCRELECLPCGAFGSVV